MLGTEIAITTPRACDHAGVTVYDLAHIDFYACALCGQWLKARYGGVR
jgi:hypothetical protein